VVPDVKLNKDTMYVPGTDGQKMSKSYDNFINIFLPEKELKEVINKKIATDSTALEDPKDPSANVISALIRLISGDVAADELNQKLIAGGYGWGHAKKDLLQAILTRFEKERAAFDHWMAHPDELNEVLSIGADKARSVAQKTLSRMRNQLGYGA